MNYRVTISINYTKTAPSVYLTIMQLHMPPWCEDGGSLCYYMAKARLRDVNVFGLSVSDIQISNIKMIRDLEFSKFGCEAMFALQTNM